MFPGFFRPVQLAPGDDVPILVNCTPHEIRFQDNDGATVEVQPSGYTLKATPVESPAGERNGATLVKTTFVASDEGDGELAEIEARGFLPVGSIVSAQAWPGRVVCLVPVEGYERKPPAERLYRCDKFTVF